MQGRFVTRYCLNAKRENSHTIYVFRAIVIVTKKLRISFYIYVGRHEVIIPVRTSVNISFIKEILNFEVP